MRKSDGVLFAGTFAGVLALGLAEGVGLGLVSALACARAEQDCNALRYTM